MKEFFEVIVIPVGIGVVILGVDALLQIIGYKRQQKRDEEKRKEVDRLLEVDLQDWYQNEYQNI